MICLVGLSPQVVTEAVYGLITQSDPPFIPTEVHLIVNGAGERAVLHSFINAGSSPLEDLQIEYLGEKRFDIDPRKHLHVIQRNGEPVEDIQSIEDNAAMADLMLKVVRELAADSSCAIHASIAGGRKSMSYYLGHVMTLVGRSQDRMSHVLLNQPFERVPGFFYPPKVPKDLRDFQGNVVSTASANVVLVPIAFVRLNDGLRNQVVSPGISYTDLIEQAQVAISKSKLRLYVSEKIVCYGEKSIKLTPRLFAWYLYFAERKKQSKFESPSLVTVGAIQVGKDFGSGVGLDQAQLSKCCTDSGAKEVLLHKYLVTDFRPVISDIKKKFSTGFGIDIAQRIAISGPRGRKGKDGQYGLLGVDAEDVEIFQAKVKITSI